MAEVVIRVHELGKKYVIGHESRTGANADLRDVLATAARSMLRKAGDLIRGRSMVEGDEFEDMWAVRDLNFEVKKGEIVGIIGRNGAGKSTLLKILSRIVEPTIGEVEIVGRVASLLEVGTGFHPELTGRENVYLNGAILGMHQLEIRRKFDEIVAFAEIERFLDTPVKRYSSGMYMRLAFAVAAHLEPEILIVDEVLSVGDAEFQRKCIGKISDVASGGRTVLFVSHNMPTVSRLCGRAILLESGRVLADGPPVDVTRQYLVDPTTNTTAFVPPAHSLEPGSPGTVLLIRAEVIDAGHRPARVFSVNDDVFVRIEYQVREALWNLRVGFRLHAGDSSVILTSGSGDSSVQAGEGYSVAGGIYSSVCRIPKQFLNYGRFSLTIASDIPNRQINFLFENALTFSIEAGLDSGKNLFDGRLGVICPALEWTTVRTDRPED